MGFDVSKTHKSYVLEFDDPDYEGLEIRMRGLTLNELFEFDRLEEACAATPTDIAATEKAVRLRNELFAHKVIDWNLEEGGVAAPFTAEWLGTQDPGFVGRMLMAWRNAVAGVSSPLDGSSTSGNLSLVEQIPMETLSHNQAS